ncbi:MAG: hypothetical protein AAF744_14580 [Pseudomonadota bacterium]
MAGSDPTPERKAAFELLCDTLKTVRVGAFRSVLSAQDAALCGGAPVRAVWLTERGDAS